MYYFRYFISFLDISFKTSAYDTINPLKMLCKSIYYLLTKQQIGGGNFDYKTLQPNDLTPIKSVTRRFAIRTYHIL